MPGHEVEIAVVVEQLMAFLDTERGDENIRRAAWRDTEPAHSPVVLRRCERQLMSAEVEARQRKQPAGDAAKLALAAHALQYFLKHAVA